MQYGRKIRFYFRASLALLVLATLTIACDVSNLNPFEKNGNNSEETAENKAEAPTSGSITCSGSTLNVSYSGTKDPAFSCTITSFSKSSQGNGDPHMFIRSDGTSTPSCVFDSSGPGLADRELAVAVPESLGTFSVPLSRLSIPTGQSRCRSVVAVSNSNGYISRTGTQVSLTMKRSTKIPGSSYIVVAEPVSSSIVPRQTIQLTKLARGAGFSNLEFSCQQRYSASLSGLGGTSLSSCDASVVKTIELETVSGQPNTSVDVYTYNAPALIDPGYVEFRFSVFDPTTSKTVGISKSSQIQIKPGCSKSTYFNVVQNACVAPTVACPSNAFPNDSGVCQCVAGFNLAGGRCVIPSIASACATNSSRKNGSPVCTCSSGFESYDNVCVSVCPSGSNRIAGVCQCSPGQVLNQAQTACVVPDQPFTVSASMSSFYINAANQNSSDPFLTITVD